MLVYKKIITATASVLVLAALMTTGEAAKSQLNSVSGNSSGILPNTTEKTVISNSSSTRAREPESAPIIPPVSKKHIPEPAAKVDPAEKEVSQKDDDGSRQGRYYSPYLSPYEQHSNPFPNYYPPQLGGSTGYGNAATSCAYAYPNRRYTCYGLGK